MKKIAVLLFLAFCACTSSPKQEGFTPPVFKSKSSITAKTVGPFMSNSTFDLDHYGDYLVVNAIINNAYLHIISKETGNIVADFTYIGQGPGEVSGLEVLISTDKTGNVYWFETDKKKLHSQHIDSILKGSKQIHSTDLSKLEKYFYNVIATPQGYFACINDVLLDFKNTKRFVMIDTINGYSYYQGYPDVKKEKRTLEQMFIQYISSVKTAIHPERNKIAIIEAYSGILEIFDLSDTIVLTATKAFYPYQDNRLSGFADIYATKDYLFAIKMDTSLDGMDDTNSYNQIMVFDWDGNEVHLFEADYNLFSLCVDEESETIYAIGQGLEMMSDLEIVSFKYELE